MSYASPTNNFDFESLFLEEEQEVPLNFYQSPTESLLSTSSSGTDHTNSSNEHQQQQITYDVISDGYVFGNDFDMNAQKQKGLKQDDLAAANPFYNQATAATNNQFSPLNPLNNFLYNQNQKPGFMGYQNPQLMGQLGMYFPHTFPNVFPQFGNQPFPFPNNNLLYTSPNTSPIGLTTSPNSNNSTGENPPSSNTSSNSTKTTPSTTATQPAETKTKASRRKSAKKNTKSSSTTTTTVPSTTTPNKAEENTSPSSSTTSPIEEQKSTKVSTPEATDSDNSNQSSEKEENDSSSSSGKKSDEKKRKRKSKKEGKESKALTPEEEKELKRQRRLIKNRESAQASRERKKIYIQGLEKKVDGLSQEFNELQGHVASLEEENEILRQRLKMLGEVVEEPSHKKRKMAPMTSSGQMKVPIPMDSRSFANPFMLDFWSLFGMQQQLQAQPTPDMPQLNPRVASSSRRVVMFIMLFCVAMFLVLPHSSDIKFDSQTATTTTTEQPESVTSRLSPASRKLASTDQKETMVDVSIDASQKPFVDEDFKKNVAELYQQFQQVRSEASEESSEEKPIDDLASRINVVFDTDKISLSFPKTILVKKEEESDEMVDEEKFSNATTDEKLSSLSTKLLKEICRVVNH